MEEKEKETTKKVKERVERQVEGGVNTKTRCFIIVLIFTLILTGLCAKYWHGEYWSEVDSHSTTRDYLVHSCEVAEDLMKIINEKNELIDKQDNEIKILELQLEREKNKDF